MDTALIVYLFTTSISR